MEGLDHVIPTLRGYKAKIQENEARPRAAVDLSILKIAIRYTFLLSVNKTMLLFYLVKFLVTSSFLSYLNPTSTYMKENLFLS